MKRRLKKQQRFRFFKVGEARSTYLLSNYVMIWDPRGLEKAFDMRMLCEAHEARRRFATGNLPAHEMTNLVWMQNCKHIAARAAGGQLTPDWLDTLWRAMALTSPSLSRRTFTSYLALLDEIGQGKTKTKPLQSTTFELPRNRARAAGDAHLSMARQPSRPLLSLPGIRGPSNPSAEAEQLQLRHTMHSKFGPVFS